MFLIAGQPIPPRRTLRQKIRQTNKSFIDLLNIGLTSHNVLGGGNSNILLFSPRNLGKILNLTSIFFKWGETTNQCFVVVVVFGGFSVSEATTTTTTTCNLQPGIPAFLQRINESESITAMEIARCDVLGRGFWVRHMGVSENRGTPKWMVYDGKPC